MPIHYLTIDLLIKDLSPEYTIIVAQIRNYFHTIPTIQKSIKRNCLHYRFANGFRCYINFNRKIPVLGFSRGTWLVYHYPLLVGLFDKMGKMVAKIIIKDRASITYQGIKELLQLIDQLPQYKK